MKFLLINIDYKDFQRSLYGEHPGLENQTYEEQQRVRMDSLFGMADFYSSHLKELGHEAWDVHYNEMHIQKQWAKENSVPFRENTSEIQFRLRRKIVPWWAPVTKEHWMLDILAAQIKAYRPDVLYNLALVAFDSSFLRSLKGYYGVAIGQHASHIPKHDLSEYDLILSSLPNQVDYFRSQGIKSERFKLGFEPKVLSRLSDGPKKYDVAFVGGVADNFKRGTFILEELCRRRSVKVWGYGVEELPKDSPIRAVHQGPAWGLHMYQILRDSKILFNRHIDFAEKHANNMRLYEGTGVGSMLLTDNQIDLPDLFEPGREVVAYNSAEECAELADYYLAHEEERDAIARAGQKKTLSEYTYLQRMEELIPIAEQALAAKSRSASGGNG